MSATTANEPELILGSASPRRAELLDSVGCGFEVLSVSVDEKVHPKEDPMSYLDRVTQNKSDAVWRRLGKRANDRDFAVLCADTVVVSGGEILGKPGNFEEAVCAWEKLSGAQHKVLTGIRLSASTKSSQFQVVETLVEFDAIDHDQMSAYWLSEEPQDKAGGYAIQGLASAWVKAIHGSYSNVVGLPLRETNQLLRNVGLNWL